MQAAKSRTAMLAKRIPACAQPLERFGDNDLAVTKLTTAARIRKVEHASRRARTRKPVRAFSHALRACHDYIVTPARVLTAALLFLPLAATACPRTEALTDTEAKAEATVQPTADPAPTIASSAESEAEEEEDATPEVLARVAARTAAAAARWGEGAPPPTPRA